MGKTTEVNGVWARIRRIWFRPLLEFRESKSGFRECGVRIKASGLFDADWYRRTYADIPGAHEDPLQDYITAGWKVGRAPGPDFDPAWYREHNPDLVDLEGDPLLHFIEYGRSEGRTATPQQQREASRRLIEASGMFDTSWYRARYHAEVGVEDPILHYLRVGWRKGCSPSELFDVPAYLEVNSDLRAKGVEPLEHFLRYGAMEGRGASVSIDLSSEVGSALPAQARALILDLTPDFGTARSINELNAEPLINFIVSVCQNRRVMEVGFRGTSSLELVVALISASARSTRLLVDTRPAEASGRLLRVAERLKVSREVASYINNLPISMKQDIWQPIWTETAATGWIIKSYLYERDLKNKIGEVEVLVALSRCYYDFEVLRILERLAYLTDDLVIFDYPIIKPFEFSAGGTTISFSSSDIWFAGDINDTRAAAVDWHLQSRGVVLDQFKKIRGHLTRQQISDRKLSEVWWWFVGMEGLKKLMSLAGLQFISSIEIPDNVMATILARKSINQSEFPLHISG